MQGLSPHLLYEALSSEFGVIIQTDNPELARQKLYAMRKELNDPDLDCLSILSSPTNPNQDLWIVKRKSDEKEGAISPPEGDTEPSTG